MTPTSSPKPKPVSSPSPSRPRPTSTPAFDMFIKEMSLEEKIGQVMAIGFDSPMAYTGLQEMIEQYHVGGIIFFARNVSNPAQMATLTRELQALAINSGHPGLILAIDQEGGRVARLTEAQGFTEFPGAMALAATGKVEIARQAAQALASEMLAVGLNMDFAPDLDVNNNPSNPVIGIRSFGSDPQKVAEFGVAFLQGLQAKGVAAIGKHFPGHGDTAVDSHVNLPLVPHDRARLEAVEFVPFKAAMMAGVSGIMSAHVAFPAIEPDTKLPATLSSKVLVDLLRTDMGFTGLVTTDALEMGALGANGYPVPLAAATALQAGADLLLFNRDHELHKQAFNLIREWIQTGKIPLARLEDAVQHVLALKARFGLLEPLLPAGGRTVSGVAAAETRQLSRQIAAQSITLLRDDASLLPLAADDRLVVIEPPTARGLGKALGATIYEVSDQPTSKEIEMVLNLIFNNPKVIVATSDVITNTQQATLVKALQKAKARVIVVAVRSPYDLLSFPEVTTYLATYGIPPATMTALVDMLNGKITPAGHLPVELPGLYALGAGMDHFKQ